MQIDMSSLKNFFNDLKHIKEPLPRFRVAQLLFIWSLTFAWCKEGFMRITAGLALLLMWKTIPLPRFSLVRKDFSRTTWFIVLAFFIWIFTVPLIFGATTLAQELRSFLRPLEVLIFVLLSLFFFRGEDFEERFTFWSIVGLCAFIFSCAVNRYMNNFNDSALLDNAFLNFAPSAAINYITMWIGCLFYYMFRKGGSILIRFLTLLAISLAFPLSIVSYSRGSILVCVATILFSLFFAFLLIRQSVSAKLYISILLIIFCCIIPLAVATSVSTSNPIEIWHSRMSLRMHNTTRQHISIENFSTGRWSTWKQTLYKIKEHPIAGYGLGLSFSSFNIRSNMSRELNFDEIITHPHNTILQAAIYTGLPGVALFLLSQLVLFILAISKTVASKQQILYFTFVIMIIAKFFAGITDSFFMPARYFLVPFWCLAFYVMFNDSQSNESESI